ncbi:hypothetical protein O5904_24120, partial [Escherichia coli]|nr:hypothetical protein [Escherichia coli]
NQYARDVVRGKIVACQFVIQACQRHLDDLMAEKSKSFRYRFDKDLAETKTLKRRDWAALCSSYFAYQHQSPETNPHWCVLRGHIAQGYLVVK